ncbi:MAG TPA: ubiquinone/menaquinone biosynthesis methyltransferase [Aggregatilineales bacterium]|nr:ubiquinone/menaquinone biosynthesis methyltransferase [Aggregatilineales bacterium]
MPDTGYKSPEEVRAMFGRIAPRYDLMNRLMTFGQDMRWRRFLVHQLNLRDDSISLDIATGTGDIAFEARKQFPGATIIASDFALPMMQFGKRRPMGRRVVWTAADALNLAFPDETFDAVMSGYLFRNVPDIERALSEQCRILRSGGRMATLDTCPPPDNLLRPFILIHLKYLIPTLGKIIAPDPDAYTYLPASTMRYKTPEDFAVLMRNAGFLNVSYQRFMFGTMAVHWGEKAKS